MTNNTIKELRKRFPDMADEHISILETQLPFLKQVLEVKLGRLVPDGPNMFDLLSMEQMNEFIESLNQANYHFSQGNDIEHANQILTTPFKNK